MNTIKFDCEIVQNTNGDIFLHKDGIYTVIKDTTDNSTLTWILKYNLKKEAKKVKL